MSKSSKIKKKQDIFSIPVTSPRNINTKSIPVGEMVDRNLKTIIFSYKYFSCSCLKNKIFNNCFKNIDDYAIWITLCVERITKFSTMNIGDLIGAGTSARFHPVEDIHLNKLREILSSINANINIMFPQNESNDFYELSFGTSSGRMFGYLIENIYYVLLMDPNHLVYQYADKGAKQDLYFKLYDPWKELLTEGNEIRR